MTNNGNGSTTMVRDIFGNEIPQANNSASNANYAFSSTYLDPSALARAYGAPQDTRAPNTIQQLPNRDQGNHASQSMFPSNNSPVAQPQPVFQQQPFLQQANQQQHQSAGRGSNGLATKLIAGISALTIMTGATAGLLAWHPWNPDKPVVQTKPVTKPTTSPKTAVAEPVDQDAAMYAKMAKSTVYLNVSTAQGNSVSSGFVVAPNVIATDYHCVEGILEGKAHLIGDKVEYTIAGILAADPAHDLALIYVPGLDAPALPLAQNDDLAPGTKIWGCGNPMGLEGFASQGNVSSSAVDSPNNMLIISMLNQWQGNSGSAICNARGEVVGIMEAVAVDLPSGMAGTILATRVSALRALLEGCDLQARINDIRQTGTTQVAGGSSPISSEQGGQEEQYYSGGGEYGQYGETDYQAYAPQKPFVRR